MLTQTIENINSATTKETELVFLYKSDILFYGGMNQRREKILTRVIDALHRAHGYKVLVVNQVFGD